MFSCQMSCRLHTHIAYSIYYRNKMIILNIFRYSSEVVLTQYLQTNFDLVISLGWLFVFEIRPMLMRSPGIIFKQWERQWLSKLTTRMVLCLFLWWLCDLKYWLSWGRLSEWVKIVFLFYKLSFNIKFYNFHLTSLAIFLFLFNFQLILFA